MGKGLVNGYLAGHDDVTHIDEGVLDYLIQNYNIKTMLDIGCGPGGMLDLAESKGLQSYGLDGDYTLPHKDNRFIIDFTKTEYIPGNASKAFDLAWSVEFVEHVRQEFMENFLTSFDRCKYICMTGAPPGTPGNHHVNCQPAEYWIKVFEKRGFKFNDKVTKEMKQASTMKRDFMRDNGLFFEKDAS